jgi:hypothetical protein
MAFVRKNLDEIVAELPQVQAAVKRQAMQLEARMKGLILPHSKTGNLFRSVDVERAPSGKDQLVTISAHYAVPVNYGFEHNHANRHIAGISFIKGAIYG